MLLSAVFGQEPVTIRKVSEGFIFDTATFSQCHASSLAEIHSGGVLAVWFGGSFEGASDVGIWSSEHINGKWSEPTLLVRGEIKSGQPLPCWNPVLFKINDTIFGYIIKKESHPESGMEKSLNPMTREKPGRLRSPLQDMMDLLKTNP